MRNLSAFKPNGLKQIQLADTPLFSDANLVSYWKLDEASGNAADSKGSNTLTNSNVTFSSGKFGNGAVFNSTSDFLQIADASQTGLDITGDFSFSGWVNSSSNPTNSYQFLYSKWSSTSNQRGVHIYYENYAGAKKIGIDVSSTGVNAETASWTYAIDTSIWYHVVYTYTAATAKHNLYINGVSQGEVTKTFTSLYNNTAPASIGNEPSDAKSWSGSIDDVAIFSKALTAAEVSQLYYSGSTKAYYPLNGNSTDYSGNGNHGTETAITYPQGRFGQAARFNGSSSRIQAEDSASISLTGNYTISVWANPTALPGAGAFSSLVCKFDGTGNTGGYDLRLVESTGQKIGLVNGYSNTQDGGDVIYTLPLNKWSNIIGIYNGATVQIFVNGYSIGSVSCTNNPVDNTKKLNIGNFGYYTPTTNELGRYFNGLIDEVIIESRAWTAKEVETYYRKSALNYRKAGWITKLLQAFRITETATLSEVPSVLRQRLFSVSETATLTESITSALGKIFEIIESVSLSETFSAVRTFAFNVAESIGLTEVLARVRKKWSNVDKNTATFTNEDKNSSDWVNRIKN